MLDLLKTLAQSRKVVLATALAAVGFTTAAIGLPWDVDMADGQSKKGYSHVMAPLPEGVVAQPNVLTPTWYVPNASRYTPEGQALTSPIAIDEASLAQGEEMYKIYCTPCHGDGENLGPVAQPGRFPGVVKLSGKAGALKQRSDGYVYLTIRNGGAIMPSYGWAMNDDEIWSIVHYVRTLPDSAYIPPAPPADEEASK